MTRKISVLFVGTSEQRGRLAQQLLAEHGCDVSVEMAFAHDSAAESDGAHDLIAVDGGEQGRELILMNGSGARARVQAHVRTLDELPEAVSAALRELAPPEETASVDALRELVAGLPGVVFRCGTEAEGKVDFMNSRAVEICGFDRERFVGRSNLRLLALLPAADRRALLAAVRCSEANGEPFSLEHRVRCANGEMRWLWHRGCVYPERREKAELESFLVDITDRKNEEEQLAWLANHDALTGLANRSLFSEQVGKSIRRADRHGEMVACLFLDLDRFKQINDSRGHACGDDLLRQVAERLKRCVRGNDLVGRLGGDEFVVLLDGIEEPQDAGAAARKILDELDRPYSIGDEKLSVSASIGISCYPGDATDRASLLRNADAAMYRVKSAGRHDYRFHAPEMSARAFETLAVTDALRKAIAAREISLVWQPRIELETGRVSCVEALARWRTDEFGDVPVERFVALAEDVGLVGMLGDVVLHAACEQANKWTHAGFGDVRVSVNLSAQQFRDIDLVKRIDAVLRRTRLSPARLELEIRESTLMQDPLVAAEILRQLKALDVRLTVDDFGTGYSSLHLLQKFQLDYLKVDRSFLNGIPADEDEIAVTEAIIAMAKRLDLGVVAEGVETTDQGNFVRNAGCDEAQGYLFCAPCSGDAIQELMGRRVH